MEFLLQPNVYSTGVSSNLLSMLDHMWLRDHVSGNGCLYIISGFSNYNGGVRFYPSFIDHTRKGGRIIAVVGGSTSQRLSSIQVAEALLNCGVELYVVNRKRLVIQYIILSNKWGAVQFSAAFVLNLLFICPLISRGRLRSELLCSRSPD